MARSQGSIAVRCRANFFLRKKATTEGPHRAVADPSPGAAGAASYSDPGEPAHRTEASLSDGFRKKERGEREHEDERERVSDRSMPSQICARTEACAERIYIRDDAHKQNCEDVRQEARGKTALEASDANP